MRLKRHVEDRNGITKDVVPTMQRRRQHARPRTAGRSDFDDKQQAKNQGHGHPREARERFER